MTTDQTRIKKLIEVAIPLKEINTACKADKDRKTGTIRNLHKWFAPMPLPAWRALLFAALIDDPEDDNKRVALLDLIKRLVANGADLPEKETLEEAKSILARQFPGGVPTVMDPFCGGGSTLVEAQRLGLPTFGSDLNPVPALISKTLTEILPKVYGEQSLHLDSDRVDNIGGTSERNTKPFQGAFTLPSAQSGVSAGYQGLLSDVRYYADRIRADAFTKLSDVFPTQNGETPVAWLWARTAQCPNPACGVRTILTSSWWLCKRKGNLAWIQPEVSDGQVNLRVISKKTDGKAQNSPKIGNGVFECLSCGATLDSKYLRAEGKSGALGTRMTAVVSDTKMGRIYRSPTKEEIAASNAIDPDTLATPDAPLVGRATTNLALYGLATWTDIYLPRQLLLLGTFSDLVAELPGKIRQDGGSDDWVTAITTLLGLAVGKLAHGASSQTRWKFDSRSGTAKPEGAFGRNDLPMTWDFAETYPFSDSAMSWTQCINTMLAAIPYAPNGNGTVTRADARSSSSPTPALVATDPPYFDAIGYADLSDFFYLWHRRSLRRLHPDLYSTVATPKVGELTAIPIHHGNDRDVARRYFIDGFTEVFRNLQSAMAPNLPMLVVYASKEQRTNSDEQSRWASILTAMIAAELEITGTLPVHGTGSTRMIGQGSNAVASYIVMVCRPRDRGASTSSLAEFNRSLRRELGPAIRDLQAASVLPEDLPQAALGPGMQIYSRYHSIVDQTGNRVSVEQALQLINTARGEVLDEQEGELDSNSRFAVTWWDKYAWEPGEFGEADKVARAYGLGVDDVMRAHVVTSRANRVQLIGSGNLDRSWFPAKDSQPTAWESVHHLADRLINAGGELEASQLMGALGTLQDPTRALVYRLHDIAAKKGRTADQERYNALISSWVDLVRLGSNMPTTAEGLF